MVGEIIEYDTFIRLNGADLVDYMEPLIIHGSATIEEGILSRLISEMQNYDEHHTVYALLLVGQHSPEKAAHFCIRYLSHDKPSVLCTAINILNSLPVEVLTDEFFASLESFLNSHTVMDGIYDIVERLQRRKRMHK